MFGLRFNLRKLNAPKTSNPLTPVTIKMVNAVSFFEFGTSVSEGVIVGAGMIVGVTEGLVDVGLTCMVGFGVAVGCDVAVVLGVGPDKAGDSETMLTLSTLLTETIEFQSSAKQISKTPLESKFLFTGFEPKMKDSSPAISGTRIE